MSFAAESPILVTGGLGFIGSNFIRAWLADPEAGPVVNLDKQTYAANPANLAELAEDERYIERTGDIADPEMVRAVIASHQPRAVVNFAAESHVDRSIEGPNAFLHTNVAGTHTLLQETHAYWRHLPAPQRRAFRFLHVSTDEVYGDLGPADPPFTETSPYRPNSPYAASKAAADHFVRAYHQTYGLPTLTTNCSNNYGPFQHPEKLIPLMIHKARAGDPLPIYGDGSNVRDWLYVSDHCRALTQVLESGHLGEIYNIGGDCERTNRAVVETVCDLLDEALPDSPHRPHRGLITFVPDRPGHDRRYAIDFHKLHQELGWRPLESFTSGIRKTVAWYLANDAWTEAARAGGYTGERIGLL